MNARDEDLERICQFAKTVNFSQQKACTYYGEQKEKNRKQAYHRTIEFIYKDFIRRKR